MGTNNKMINVRQYNREDMQKSKGLFLIFLVCIAAILVVGCISQGPPAASIPALTSTTTLTQTTTMTTTNTAPIPTTLTKVQQAYAEKEKLCGTVPVYTPNSDLCARVDRCWYNSDDVSAKSSDCQILSQEYIDEKVMQQISSAAYPGSGSRVLGITQCMRNYEAYTERLRRYMYPE
jgi:hypothetical protein